MKERECTVRHGNCEPAEVYGQWGPHKVKIVCFHCNGFLDWGKKMNFLIHEGHQKLAAMEAKRVGLFKLGEH